MRWRKSFLSLLSPSSRTSVSAPGIVSLVLLALCSPVQLDHTESQLQETICTVAKGLGSTLGDIGYPVCAETRWGTGDGDGWFGTTLSPTIAHTHTQTQTQTQTIPVSSSSTETVAEGASGGHVDIDVDGDADMESPLDNSNFLSFEEWKKLNLAKAGQSAENVGGKRPVLGPEKRQRMRTEGINNALDALGDEAEIELEFGGFAAENEDIRAWEKRERVVAAGGGGSDTTEGEVRLEGIPRRGAARRKDAGVTCKERFNYASFDCAATVIKTNPQCTGSSSVLIENKDSYMLNECRAQDKFLVLELCDDILVDTVVLANYEFFSSIFRTFRVSVSDRYPAKQWREIGAYEAANTREVQAFAVENPLIWARYLRIEFLTHYGNEFYCPLSLVRVHGTTMMEEYKNEGEAAKGEEDLAEIAAEQAPAGTAEQGESATAPSDDANITKEAPNPGYMDADEEVCLSEMRSFEDLLFAVTGTCPAVGATRASQSDMSALTSTASDAEVVNDEVESATVTSTIVTTSDGSGPEAGAASNSNYTQSESDPKESATGAPKPEGGAPVESSRTQQQPAPLPPPLPNPTTQESFFKSFHKRLQILETNSSLSLLYIEAQSRILRDAFTKVEKRQLTKTSNFLENLNNTVLSELRDFRQQYDHVWHSVTYQVEQQRQQYNRELRAVSAQLGVLADELVFQKRISIIQSVFVLICFGMVLFSRSSGAVGTYLELPRVQSFVARSHFRSRSVSPSYDSPSASPGPSDHHHDHPHDHDHSASSSHSHSSYSKSMAQHHHIHTRSPSEESHPDTQTTSMSGPTMTFSGPSPPPSDPGSPQADVKPEYEDSELSGPPNTSNDGCCITTQSSSEQGDGNHGPPPLVRQGSDSQTEPIMT